jgi:TPR repeat protein
MSEDHFKVEETSIAEIHAAYLAGKTTARQVTQAFLDRIEAYDRRGPALWAIVVTNPKALDDAQAAVWFRKAAEQGDASAQHNLGVILLEGAGGAPQDVKAGVRSLAAAAQQGQLGALAALAAFAGEREVAKACCVGCGATAHKRTCPKCHVARFCSQECVLRAWPVHKPHCKRWQAEAQAAAESAV